MKQWYELLFEKYALKYEKESFTKGTIGECDFIEQEINFNKDTCILDIGCGTGRHARELAKRGYKNITGVDLSESLLNHAMQIADEEGLKINFQRKDARKLSFSNEFDLVIMICEGAFPLMETDEMNFLILKNAAKALKESGKIIFTTLNGLFPLFHSVKDFLSENSEKGNAVTENLSFDLMTFREHSTIVVEDDFGNKKTLECSERYYVPSEISWLLKSLNYKKIDVYAAKLGAFSRNDKLTTEDFEMLVIANK
jgi:2-polyprenyl-3-methyl-5-hydroxy-6-metoxy-1,4-benzoquinol methylase